MRILFNADPEEIVSIKDKRRILFVHVGKCAGESIMHALRSQLSDEFVMFEMHVYDSNRRIREVVDARPADLTYLIAKRDPIDRYVSAFNWDKHNLFLSNKLAGTIWSELYQMFPTVDLLLTGLRAEDAETRAHAEALSRFGHMGMGQAWYTPIDVLRALPAEQTFFLDTSSLLPDLVAVLHALRGSPTSPDFRIPTMKSGFKDTYENSEQLFPTGISPENREVLRSHISEDISIYKSMTEKCDHPRSNDD